MSEHLGPWSVNDSGNRLKAHFRSVSDSRVKVTDCHFPAASCGERTEKMIEQDTEKRFFCVTHAYRGQQLWKSGSNEFFIDSPTAAFWRSDVPLSFEITSQVSEFIVLIPVEFASAFVHNMSGLVGTILHPEKGMNAVLFDLLSSYRQNWKNMSSGELLQLNDTLLGIVSAIEKHAGSEDNRSLTPLYARVTDYIDRNLEDENLSPLSISHAMGISPRYLHYLFSQNNKTVAKWIKERRLKHVHKELCSNPKARVTDVAFRWGFKDASHFSRIYKETFGLTPRETRKQVLNQR